MEADAPLESLFPPLGPGQLEVLTRAAVADHRPQRGLIDDRLYKSVLKVAAHWLASNTRLAYTAFDGDLFELTPQMRAWTFRSGRIPANPESIVGYKESVDAHKNKAGVLLDDLAIVDRCDDLIIFTDVEPEPEAAMRGLAEGVIVELLYFLAKRGKRPDSAVFFVPVAALFGEDVIARPFEFDHVTTAAYLGADQQGIARLLGSVESGLRKLPTVAYIVHDPLDAKYSNWLRPLAYARQRVPLVPSLALQTADVDRVVPTNLAAGLLFAARLRLLDLAGEVWVFSPQDLSRDESITTRITKALWKPAKRPLRRHGWRDLDIPKITDRDWALTEREASTLIDPEQELAATGLV